MGRALHVYVAAIVVAVLTLRAAPAAASDGIFVCNKGSVSVSVAWLDDSRALLNTVNFWKASGWYTVTPGNCDRVWSNDGVVHLVFAIRTSQGDLGVYRPQLDWSRIGSLPRNNRRSEICVPTAAFEDSGSMNQPGDYLPPCQGRFKLAETVGSFYLEGRARLTLNVAPSEADYRNLTTYLERRSGETTPDAPPTAYTPPPRQKSVLETAVESYNQAQSHRSNLLASCNRAGATWGAAQRENYCRCMSNAAADSLDDVGIARLVSEWNLKNLDALVGKGFFVQEARKCPAMPFTPLQSATPPTAGERLTYVVFVGKLNPKGILDSAYSQEEAQRVAKTLVEQKSWPVFVSGPLRDGMYHIRIGPLVDLASAVRIKNELVVMGYTNSLESSGRAKWD